MSEILISYKSAPPGPCLFVRVGVEVMPPGKPVVLGVVKMLVACRAIAPAMGKEFGTRLDGKQYQPVQGSVNDFLQGLLIMGSPAGAVLKVVSWALVPDPERGIEPLSSEASAAFYAARKAVGLDVPGAVMAEALEAITGAKVVDVTPSAPALEAVA